MPNAFAHTKKLEELKSFFFNIQRYQLRRLMEDTERDEEWLKKVLAYTNCIRAQFTYTHTWAACYALMLSPWGLDEETKKRILEKENDKKRCKKTPLTPPLTSIPGIPEDLQMKLWMLPATHHLHNIKEAQKDKGWIDKAARMVLVISSKFSAYIKEFDEFGEAFLSNMLGFDKEVSRKILDSVKVLLLQDILEKEPRTQDAVDPLHQMVAKLLVDKNTPSTSSAPPSRPEPPHSAGSLGLSTGPSTSTDPSGSSSPHHAEQSQPHQPLSDDKDAPQQESETQTEQNTEWRGLIKKFRENIKDFEWAQAYLVYPSPFPHEVVLNMEEWETLGQLKDRGKKDVKKKKKVVKEKLVAKKVKTDEGKGEVVTLRGVAVRFIVDDDEQGELRLERVGPEDSGANEDEDARVPVRCVERMIESVVIRPGVPVKDDEDDLQEDDQDQQPAQHVNRNLEMKKLRRGWVTRRQKAAQQSSGIQAATQEPQDLEQQASNAPEDLQQQQEPVASDQDAAPQHQSDPRAPQEGQQEPTTPDEDDPDRPAIVKGIVEDIRREVQPFLPAEVRLVEGAADHQREEVRPMRNGEDHQMEDQVVRPVEDEVNPQEEARPDQDMEVDHQGQAAVWDVEGFLLDDVRQVEEDVADGPPVEDVPGYKKFFNLDTNTVVSVKDVIPGTSRNVATSPMRFDDSPETQQPSTSDLQKAPDAGIVEDSVNSGVDVDELEFMGEHSASSVPRNNFEKDLRVEEAPETSTTCLVNNQSSSKKIFSHESVNVKIGKLNSKGHALLRALLDESPDALEIIPFAQNVKAMDVGAASSSQNNAPKDATIQEDHVVAVTEPHEAPGEEPMDTNESAENSTEHSADDEVMAVQNEANPQIEEPVVQESDQSFHASHKETSTRKDRGDQMDVDNAPEIEDDEAAETSTPLKVAVEQLTAEDDQRMDEEKNEQVTMGTGLNQEEANVGAASFSRSNASKDVTIQENHAVAVTEQQEAPGKGYELEPMDTKESAENSTEHPPEDEAMAVQSESNSQIEEPVVQENDQSFHAPHETAIIAESVSTSPETSTRKNRDDQMDVDNAPEIEDDVGAASSSPTTISKDASIQEEKKAVQEEIVEPEPIDTQETTENSNGVVQETSFELLVPPIEAEKDTDQTPMEIDSLPESSLRQNELGSVPGTDSSTRTPTTPVTENQAPMLRCEHSAVDEATVVRSDKKKTNGQEKKEIEELSAVMNEENETAKTSTLPKVAVDQLSSKTVDGEDPDEIYPEKFADVHKDQSSPKTPDDAQSSSTADPVVPTLDSSAEENLQGLPKSSDQDHQMENEVQEKPDEDTIPIPSCSETLKEDQSQANTLPDSSSCLKISATESCLQNGSDAGSLQKIQDEPAVSGTAHGSDSPSSSSESPSSEFGSTSSPKCFEKPLVEPIVEPIVESLSLPSSSNRSEEAMEEAGLKDTLDGEELEKDQDLEDDGDQKEGGDPRNATVSPVPSDACSSSPTTLPEDSFDSNVTDQGDLESLSREDQEDSDVDGSQFNNMPRPSSTSEPIEGDQDHEKQGVPGETTDTPGENLQEGDIEAQKSPELTQEAAPTTSSPRAHQEDQISHGAEPEDIPMTAHQEPQADSRELHTDEPLLNEPGDPQQESDRPTEEAEPGSSGQLSNAEDMEIDQDPEDRPRTADLEPQEPSPWTQSTSTRYPSRFSPPASPQRVVRRVDSDADDLTDEAVYHNRLLKEIFEEPMLKGELAAPSRRVQFPQEENDDEPETQRLEEEEPDQPSNQPTEIVASLENGAPLPSDQEAGLLRLLQDPKTPPNFLPFLNDVMKIHNLRKELQEKTSPQSDIPQSHTADGVSGVETERAAEEEAREEQERHHDQMAQAPASQVFQATTSQVFQAPTSQEFQAPTSQVFQDPASQVVQVPASQVSHVPIVQVSAQELIAQQMYLSQALQGTHPAARNEFDAAVQPALRAAYQQQQQQQHHHQEQQQKPRKRASGGEKKGSAPPPKTSRKNQQVPVQPPQMPQQMNYRPPNGYQGTFASFALTPLAALNRPSYPPQYFPFPPAPQYQAQAQAQAAQEAQTRAQAQAAQARAAQEAHARAQALAAQEAQARAQARAAQEAHARAQAQAAQEAQTRAQAQAAQARAAQEAHARAQAQAAQEAQERAQAKAQAFAQAQEHARLQRHAQNRARALVHQQAPPPHQIQPNAHAPSHQPIYAHPPPQHQNQVHVFPQPRIWARAAPHQQGENDHDDVQFIGYQRAQNQLPPRPSNAPLLQHLLQTPHMQAVAQSEARTHAQIQAAAQQRAQEAAAAERRAQEAAIAHQPAQEALAAHWQQLTQEQQNALHPIMNGRTYDQLQDLLQRAAEYNAQLPQPQILPIPLAHNSFHRPPTSNRFFIIGYPSSSLASHFILLTIPLAFDSFHRPPTPNRSTMTTVFTGFLFYREFPGEKPKIPRCSHILR
ncbi:unnamed protein product [Caenorhabditis brenneri]